LGPVYRKARVFSNHPEIIFIPTALLCKSMHEVLQERKFCRHGFHRRFAISFQKSNAMVQARESLFNVQDLVDAQHVRFENKHRHADRTGAQERREMIHENL
jgi:hypothetical protein